MTITVEDGSGLSTSESYISVADADTYHSNRGNTTWATLTTAQKEQALRRGTDYMQQVYRMSWMGYRKTATQALDWPRSYVYLEPYISGAVGAFPYLVSDAIVPTEVKNACAELAWKAAAGELAPDLEQRVKREKVDVLEVEYADYGQQYTEYRAIDNLLAPYLQNVGGAFRKVQR